MKRKTYLTALAALSAAAVFGTAVAAKSNGNDALPVSAAKIDMGQAVAAAEHHVGGRASRAEFQRHDSRPVFDVEVVNGSSVTDVVVSASTGKVVGATADKPDRHEDDDSED